MKNPKQKFVVRCFVSQIRERDMFVVLRGSRFGRLVNCHLRPTLTSNFLCNSSLVELS